VTRVRALLDRTAREGRRRWLCVPATLNGTPLDITEPFQNPYPSLPGTSQTLRAGVNRLEVKLESGSAAELTFFDLACR